MFRCFKQNNCDSIQNACFDSKYRRKDCKPSLLLNKGLSDGCKCIGASTFLEFLNKNKHLVIDGKQIISDKALVANTLMIAQFRPEEKEKMVKLVMNFLNA